MREWHNVIRLGMKDCEEKVQAYVDHLYDCTNDLHRSLCTIVQGDHFRVYYGIASASNMAGRQDIIRPHP